MPLNRSNVTIASRVMLPAYIVLATAYGFVYVADPFGRLAGAHSLDFPRKVMGGSMVAWGLLFLGLALFLSLMLFKQARRGYVLGLCICAAAWLAWAFLYAVSIWTDPRASILAPVGPLFYCTASIASALSLLARET